jgi:proteasome lid subunit RPN8/RPN11
VERISRIRIGADSGMKFRHNRAPYYRAQGWQPLEQNGHAQPAVQIFLTQHAFIRICAHAGSDLQNEVGGWLAGKTYLDNHTGKPFIVINTVLPAEFTLQGSAFLTFTQESQVNLHATMTDLYPDLMLLGWFHTHPRMGVFFSEWDRWLHENFFPESWQVGLVIEPFSASGGFFQKQVDGSLDTRQYFGFNELFHRRRRSIVHWRNLVPVENKTNDTRQL